MVQTEVVWSDHPLEIFCSGLSKDFLTDYAVRGRETKEGKRILTVLPQQLEKQEWERWQQV